MTGLNPIYGEDYSAHWPVDVTGKTVLDIGADYGSTAAYFMSKGALEVICVEGNPLLFEQLTKNLQFLPGCTAIHKMIQSIEDWKEILDMNGEVVKVDVEGAEQLLLQLDPWTLQQHSEYIIETHRGVDVDAFIKLFMEKGFSLIKRFSYGFGLTVLHFQK